MYKMNKFLRSAILFLHSSKYNKMYVRFVKLPVIHRVLVSPYDIKKLTGCYYERLFKSDEEYAKKTSGNNLYCAIQNDKYRRSVTPNINKYNLLNEYTTY